MLALVMVAGAAPLSAASWDLFQSDPSFFTNVTFDNTDPDLAWGVAAPPVDGGGGSALHIYDNSVVSGTGAVKLIGDLPSAQTGLVQLSFFMLTTDTDTYGSSNDAFKIRMGNETWQGSISSSSNAAISIEPRMDNDFRVKSLDGDVKAGSGYLDPNTWYRVDIVGNYNASGSALNYSLGGTGSALDPQKQDVWIDGVKLAADVAFQGSSWAVNAVTDSAYPGVQSVGFITDSNKLGGDWYLDSVKVFTDGDVGTINVLVPEPSTYAALFGLSALGLAFIRRRKTRAAA